MIYMFIVNIALDNVILFDNEGLSIAFDKPYSGLHGHCVRPGRTISPRVQLTGLCRRATAKRPPQILCSIPQYGKDSLLLS